MAQHLGLEDHEARSQKPPSSLPLGGKRPSAWTIIFCLPRCISREVVRSGVSTQISTELWGYTHYKQWLDLLQHNGGLNSCLSVCFSQTFWSNRFYEITQPIQSMLLFPPGGSSALQGEMYPSVCPLRMNTSLAVTLGSLLLGFHQTELKTGALHITV